MPKKPKFTKEEVIKAGYQIIKERGKDNLTARFLAASLNCAISPIFTLFENMEELKNDGYQTVVQYGISFFRKDCMVKMKE